MDFIKNRAGTARGSGKGDKPAKRLPDEEKVIGGDWREHKKRLLADHEFRKEYKSLDF